MKTFKRYFFAAFFLLSISGLYAQDEIYNEKPKEKITDTNKTTVSVPDFDEYFTEKDFYVNERENNKHENQIEEEVIFTEEESEDKRERRGNGVAVQIAAEIVVEVFVNALFVIATFW
jgi:hypothetical protein